MRLLKFFVAAIAFSLLLGVIVGCAKPSLTPTTKPMPTPILTPITKLTPTPILTPTTKPTPTPIPIPTTTPTPTINYKLSVRIIPPEAGNVVPSTQYFESNTEVTLKAIPSKNYRFSIWQIDALGHDPTYSIFMDSDKEVEAHFSLLRYTLNFGTNPGQGGMVIPQNAVYNIGESVNIQAVPLEGWQFDHWDGDLARKGQFVTMTIKSDINATAYFIPAEF